MKPIHPPATVGFVGLGVMGGPMAGHLIDAGYRLRVHTRTASKAEPLLERGATWCENVGDVAVDADAVCTIVGYPDDVEQTYFGAAGILAKCRPYAVLIDLTTSAPDLARRIADGHPQALDCPVSGGDVGAQAGTLSIMCGGTDEAFTAALPLLKCMGKNVVHQGGPGAGQLCKLVNQIVIAGTMLGVAEALAFARQPGLDPDTVLRSIGDGAAQSWTLDNLGPRMLAGDFEPGFFVKHFRKDMRLAAEAAQRLGMDLPGLAIARQQYEHVDDDSGTQALIKRYDP
ncbi:MAG: NAD(P)-dependent oxidoreductase [Planctomycetota bacterium]